MNPEAARGKPGRPRAIPEDLIPKVLSLYHEGLGYRRIAGHLRGDNICADWSTVRRVIKAQQGPGTAKNDSEMPYGLKHCLFANLKDQTGGITMELREGKSWGELKEQARAYWQSNSQMSASEIGRLLGIGGRTARRWKSQWRKGVLRMASKKGNPKPKIKGMAATKRGKELLPLKLKALDLWKEHPELPASAIAKLLDHKVCYDTVQGWKGRYVYHRENKSLRQFLKAKQTDMDAETQEGVPSDIVANSPMTPEQFAEAILERYATMRAELDTARETIRTQEITAREQCERIKTLTLKLQQPDFRKRLQDLLAMPGD